MKLIIAGSRTLKVTPEEIMQYCTDFNIQPSIIISGHARGIDACGEDFAHFRGLSLHGFPANWGKYGKIAGIKRNKQMASFGDALLLIWDGKSTGSANMKKEMIDLGKKVYEIIIVS